MKLHVVPASHRVLPLMLHARRDRRIIRAQPEILAGLRHQRQRRALPISGAEERVRGLEQIRLPVDRLARGDRLPGLVVQCHGHQAPPAPRQEEGVAAPEDALHLQAEVPADQPLELVRLQVVAAWAPRRDEGDAALLQVLRDPSERGVSAVLLQIADDVAEDNQVVGSGDVADPAEIGCRALRESDERKAPPALFDRQGAELDPVEPPEAVAEVRQEGPEAATDVQDRFPGRDALANQAAVQGVAIRVGRADRPGIVFVAIDLVEVPPNLHDRGATWRNRRPAPPGRERSTPGRTARRP